MRLRPLGLGVTFDWMWIVLQSLSIDVNISSQGDLMLRMWKTDAFLICSQQLLAIFVCYIYKHFVFVDLDVAFAEIRQVQAVSRKLWSCYIYINHVRREQI